LLLLFAVAHIQADEEKKTEEPAAESTDETQNAASGLIALAKFIPLGQEQKSVVIPSYNESRLSALIRAASMKRIDDKHLALTEMVITTYDVQGNEAMVVTMPTAVYDLESSILESSSRSLVSRSDFDLEGDKMLYDSTQGAGRMEGNVKMIINDSSSLQFGSDRESPNTSEETQP